MKDKRSIRGVLVALLSAVALVFGFRAWDDFAVTKSGFLDFALHRTRYEQMIARAKQSGVQPGASNKYYPPQDIMQSSGMILSETDAVTTTRDRNGHYTISIITSDHHHAGIYGHVYSDLPAKIDYADGTNDGGISPFQSLDHQINQHWWTASDNTF